MSHPLVMIDSGLDGRVALVTGANHGIGAATARALAAQGASVFLTFLRSSADERADDPGTPHAFSATRVKDASHVVDAVRAKGGRAEQLEADLSDPSVPAAIFDRVEATLGPVEILVNNAAVSQVDTFSVREQDRFGRNLSRVDAESHDGHFAVNSRATALSIAEFARRHVARGASWGRIVSVTSAGIDGFPEEVSYGASKAALESYTKAAAWELGTRGITSNVIYPPATDTGWINDDARDQIIAASPLGHVATPEEVAEVIVFLASEQARWITGQTVRLR